MTMRLLSMSVILRLTNSDTRRPAPYKVMSMARVLMR